MAKTTRRHAATMATIGFLVLSAQFTPSLASERASDEKNSALDESVPKGWRPDRECADVDCHVGLLEAQHIHGAIADMGCEACHDDNGGHRFSPADTSPTACLDCHDEGDDTIWDHAEGSAECLDCHDPHRSSYRHLLRLSVNQLCQDCHELGTEGVSVHEPVRRGRCLACHHPHRATASPLLRKPVAETCVKCHRRVVAPHGREPDPHAAMDDREGCVDCHEMHEADEPHLLMDRYSQDAYTNDPVSDHELCFGCHDEDELLHSQESGFVRDDGQNLHGAHVLIPGKGRGCRNCHQMHATDLPHMLDAQRPMGRWLAPMTFVANDTTKTCGPACHEPRSYPNRD